MKLRVLTSLLTFLLALAAHADVKPVWELQVRLDGGSNPRVKEWLKLLLPDEHLEEVVGANAIARFVGYEDEKTPGPDWIAEIKDLGDLDGIMKRLTVTNPPDAEGCYHFTDQGFNFLAWSPAPNYLRLASSTESRAVVTTPMGILGKDACLAGWVDLSRVSESEIESSMLKLPERISFSVTSMAGGVNLDLVAELSNKEAADAVRELVGQLQKEWKTEEGSEAGSSFDVHSDEKGLRVHLFVSDLRLKEVLKEMKALSEVP